MAVSLEACDCGGPLGLAPSLVSLVSSIICDFVNDPIRSPMIALLGYF